ncbi:MAG: PKD domain-containing protein, partial [Methanobacteriota archaeon]
MKAVAVAAVFLASSGILQVLVGGAAAPGITITMQATTSGWNFFLDPEHPNPTINVRVGVEVTFEIEWFDSFHAFAIYPRDTPPWEVFPGDPDAILRSRVVDENVRTATVTITFSESGTFEYYCEIHPSMHGILNVLGANEEAPSVGFIDASPGAAIPGQDVTFAASVTDANADPVSFDWTISKLCEQIGVDEFFCDGGVSVAGRTEPGGGTAGMTHAFHFGGRHYTITLTVEDPGGARDRTQTFWTATCCSFLRITTDPAAPAKIFVDGVPRDDWGVYFMMISEGRHTVSFSDVPGYGTPEPLEILAPAGNPAFAVGAFRPLGYLRVLTDPPVPSTISVDGVPRDDWGMWMAIEPGTYTVSFGAVGGYDAPPSQAVTVTAGSLSVVRGTFTLNPDAQGPNPRRFGFLRVASNPPVPTQVLVDGIPRDDWGLAWVKLEPGTYVVSFTDVPGFSTPAPQEVRVTAGETTVVEGRFAMHGSLRITLDSPVAATVFVDGLPRDTWGMWQSMPRGTYKVT